MVQFTTSTEKSAGKPLKTQIRGIEQIKSINNKRAMVRKDEIESIIQLRAEGKTYKEISTLTGRSVGTCWKYTHPISNEICMVVEPTLLTRLNEWVRKTIRR